MDKDSNSLNWFEISFVDVRRAKNFYETIFDITLEDWNLPEFEMAVFPSIPNNGKVSGALVKSEMHKPSMEGSIIYLNANPDMTPVLERIEKHGSQILMPKTHVSDDIGYMAFFVDSEGNKMALHSQQ